MIISSALLCLLASIAGISTSAADSTDSRLSAGAIAVVSGKAWVRHGQITIPTPEQEGRVTPGVAFNDANGKELGPNDQIMPGDVVMTGDDSFLKIYYKDDSIMDVGPNTTLQVKQFTLAATARKIEFTLLQGKVRTLVTRALDAGSYYRVTTPVSAMGVHGTEWVTDTYSQNGQYRTDVTVLEGKVVVDMPRAGAGPGGKATLEQVALTPGKTFSGMGSGGTVAKFSVFKMTPSQVQELVAMIPNIETKRVGSVAISAVSAPSTTVLVGSAGGEDSQVAAPGRGIASASPAKAVAPIPSTDALAAIPNDVPVAAVDSRRTAFEQQQAGNGTVSFTGPGAPGDPQPIVTRYQPVATTTTPGIQGSAAGVTTSVAQTSTSAVTAATTTAARISRPVVRTSASAATAATVNHPGLKH